MAVSNAEIFNKLMEVSDVVSRIEPTVNDLKKAVITGNGKPGLLERMNVVEIQHANEDKAKKDAKEKKEKWGARTWAIVLIGATAIIGNGIGLIVLLIRFGTIH